MARLSSTLRHTPIGGSWTVGGTWSLATLTTSLAGANNDLKYTAFNGEDTAVRGSAGNAVRVRYVVAGASTALSVSVSGNDITVNVATDGASAATSTAAQIATAVNNSATASKKVSVANATGNDGTGVVTALAFTALTGGVDRVTGAGSGAVSFTPARGLRNN